MTSPYNMKVFLILLSIKDTAEVWNIPPPPVNLIKSSSPTKGGWRGFGRGGGGNTNLKASLSSILELKIIIIFR